MPSRLRLLATVPAKLNLGLAILGRRPDGFHDLCTVMQTVTICDELILQREDLDETGFRVQLQLLKAGIDGLAGDDPGLAPEHNLAVRALDSVFRRVDVQGEFSLSMTKGIPAASGMGGASADAAAAVLLAEQASRREFAPKDRLHIAAELGSDVPFFLTGGTALVTGRGEHVAPLPSIIPTWFVVVFPHLRTPIPRKTARLFAALTPDDLGDGEVIHQQLSRIMAGQPLDPDLLGNTFSRPLLDLAPELSGLRETVATVTGLTVALSGAGPTQYVVEPDPERAESIAAQLHDRLGAGAIVFVCAPWDGPPAIRSVPW